MPVVVASSLHAAFKTHSITKVGPLQPHSTKRMRMHGQSMPCICQPFTQHVCLQSNDMMRLMPAKHSMLIRVLILNMQWS